MLSILRFDMASGKGISDGKFKIVLLGDKDVGKTSILLRYVRDEFFERTSINPISEQTKNILINGRNITLELWDTAGQERFKSLETHYYRDADAAVLVYSVVDEESFSSLCDYWLKETLRYIPDGEMIPILVVGNKSDLSGLEDEQVDINTVKEYTQSCGLPLPLETSAKTGENIHQIFHSLATELYKRYMHTSTEATLVHSTVKRPTSSSCCGNKGSSEQTKSKLRVH